MIPTAILVGLLVGPLALERRSRGVAAALAAVACLGWGVVVGGLDGWSATTAAGGTALAAANLVVGMAVGVLVALAAGLAGRAARRVGLRI